MYTGTGALSIYNGDDAFKNNYYPTVGMTSLPGTTTDLSIRKVLKTDKTPIYANTESWTGGVSDGTYGSATMDYTMKDVTQSNLAAKKILVLLRRQNRSYGK
ncbi:polysaccharide lyase family 8 super-sandwich domain-containing protein [Paenilisteria weihenstephanensis]|uniref:polysaccharide lyase family 8 super-sandwich domain-containing protein n=1 Tax=Listeria weihenstephanensis TaxID=1006155 RepID=UPI0004BAA487|nr:polysaccharide lyase family 8 super-sandwich domain-containing protein [Listeria weihenstephanensis]